MSWGWDLEYTGLVSYINIQTLKSVNTVVPAKPAPTANCLQPTAVNHSLPLVAKHNLVCCTGRLETGERKSRPQPRLPLTVPQEVSPRPLSASPLQLLSVWQSFLHFLLQHRRKYQ